MDEAMTVVDVSTEIHMCRSLIVRRVPFRMKSFNASVRAIETPPDLEARQRGTAQKRQITYKNPTPNAKPSATFSLVSRLSPRMTGHGKAARTKAQTVL